MCGVPLVRAVCRECYNDPLGVYDRLKRLGMDLVTITDHDSIGAVEALRSRPDFFLSEEVTCTLPGGTALHVGVYDITEGDHIEFERRRDDFESLAAYLHERRLFFSANHIFSSLTGRRAAKDFELFESAFPAIETHNGHMRAMANRAAAALAAFAGKSEVGGSDAHAMKSAGCAYTEVPDARTKQEYLDGLRMGRGKVFGESGSYWKLTRDVYEIACNMVREAPLSILLAPLFLAVPLVTLGNLVREIVFAQVWSARYLQSVNRRAARRLIQETAAVEEAA
jgi:predicted metal-dependent phosphoesterase TrpH